MTEKHWRDGIVSSFDLETTGVDVTQDRIVTASLLRIEGADVQRREWLADPGVEIPEGAAKVHGITTEWARAEGRDVAECVSEVYHALRAAWAEGPVVIYNAPYDISLFEYELRRHLGETIIPQVGHVLDPLVCDKAIDPYRRGSRKLIDVARHYGIVLSEEDAHSSAGDALAAAHTMYVMAARPKLCTFTLPALHERQKVWSAQQKASFADYLETKKHQPEEAAKVRAEIGWPYRAELAPEEELAPQ